MSTVSIAEVTAYLQTHLSAKRLRHTEGVRQTAVWLAKKYGADQEKAVLAALFHDMYRELDDETLKETVQKLSLPKKYETNRNLAHSKVAAAKMARDWGITDEDLLHAVSFHTTGRAGMSLLEQVLYLADAIEPNRDYPGVDVIRQAAKVDLQNACLLSLTHTIRFITEQEQDLDQDTIRARAYVVKLIEEKQRRNCMTNKDYAMLAAKTLSTKKAQDIVVIDIQEKATFADYFVLCSGTSERQIQSLTDDIEEVMAKENLFVKSIEGRHSSGWILMDFGDMIVNLFTKEMRDRYNIEKVWGDCKFIEVED